MILDVKCASGQQTFKSAQQDYPLAHLAATPSRDPSSLHSIFRHCGLGSWATTKYIKHKTSNNTDPLHYSLSQSIKWTLRYSSMKQ